jgi:hypothetical protein
MPKYKRNYYTVDVPSDYSTDPAERFEQAFREAEERCRIYHIPATWQIVWDDGERVRVVKIHR